MEDRLIPGYFRSTNGHYVASINDTELLFATSSYTLSRYDAYDSNAVDDLRKVALQYITNIEQECPYFKFDDEMSAYDRNHSDTIRRISAEFKFYVRPFDPQECHPRDFDTLKPITIIGDKPIQPSAKTIELG
ncbi:MAG: hypothetical protein AAF244_02970 [Pseudomonadota bacterium]